MSTPAPTQTLTLSLPVVPSAPLPVVAAATPSPLMQDLAAQAASPARATMRCVDLLKGDTRERAEREADKLAQDILGNNQIIMTYGNDDLAGMNALADRLLHEVRPVKIPELRELMGELNKNMRSIERKYDVSDPKVREKYEHARDGILSWFHKSQDWLDMFADDVRSIESQLNRVIETLSGRQLELLKNVGLYDQIYDENEQEIAKVIYDIAVMELVSVIFANQADATQIGDAGMGDRGGEHKAQYADLSQRLQIRAHDWKARLFIAFATAPQVRTMRGLDIGLAQKLDTLTNSTVPTMKLTLAEWRMAVAALEAAQMANVAAESFNEWVTKYYESQGQTVSEIAMAINSPVMAAATIGAIAKSLDDQATGIITAMEYGEQRRAENNQAMAEAEKVITNATAKVSDALVEHVLSVSIKPLEIEQSVPAQPAA